jgi:nicotinamide phosphoribosyltransferase
MFKQTAANSLDSYKIGHPEQYPEGLTRVVSNFTPRSESHLKVPEKYKRNKIVWFGALALFLQELNYVWRTTFFERSWADLEKEVIALYGPFCGPNGYKATRLKRLWALGYLPLEIKALPEGTHVPIGIPVVSVTNTVDEFFWLPNSVETWLSFDLWRPATSATIAFVYRKILEEAAERTGGNKDFVMWQGHDFSARGMGGFIDGARSGLGHLTSFFGTDSVASADAMIQLYGGGVYGSVPATEHSVMCAGGKESELETFRRLIKRYPNGIVSIVSDTWNFWNVVGGESSIAAQLKEEILARGDDEFGNGKVVFRPDSGDPVKILTGYKVYDAEKDEVHLCGAEVVEEGFEVELLKGKYYLIEPQYDHYDDYCFDYALGAEISEWEAKGAVQCLAEIFGTTTNAKGFKTLNRKVGLIYGDSITPERAEQILQRLEENGYASDNVVFGIGSYTYQYNTRDTLGFAMKATYIEKDGVGEAIFKDPITDSGTKKSARGLLRVDLVDGEYVLKQDCTPEEAEGGELRVVYRDGVILVNDSFDTIRARVASEL